MGNLFDVFNAPAPVDNYVEIPPAPPPRPTGLGPNYQNQPNPAGALLREQEIAANNAALRSSPASFIKPLVAPNMSATGGINTAYQGAHQLATETIPNMALKWLAPGVHPTTVHTAAANSPGAAVISDYIQDYVGQYGGEDARRELFPTPTADHFSPTSIGEAWDQKGRIPYSASRAIMQMLPMLAGSRYLGGSGGASIGGEQMASDYYARTGDLEGSRVMAGGGALMNSPVLARLTGGKGGVVGAGVAEAAEETAEIPLEYAARAVGGVDQMTGQEAYEQVLQAPVAAAAGSAIRGGSDVMDNYQDIDKIFKRGFGKAGRAGVSMAEELITPQLAPPAIADAPAPASAVQPGPTDVTPLTGAPVPVDLGQNSLAVTDDSPGNVIETATDAAEDVPADLEGQVIETGSDSPNYAYQVGAMGPKAASPQAAIDKFLAQGGNKDSVVTPNIDEALETDGATFDPEPHTPAPEEPNAQLMSDLDGAIDDEGMLELTHFGKSRHLTLDPNLSGTGADKMAVAKGRPAYPLSFTGVMGIAKPYKGEQDLTGGVANTVKVDPARVYNAADNEALGGLWDQNDIPGSVETMARSGYVGVKLERSFGTMVGLFDRTPTQPKTAGSQATIFASPNELEDMTFDDALGQIQQPRHARFVDFTERLNKAFGADVVVRDAMGVWSDGAENTVATTFHGVKDMPYETVKVIAALQGVEGNQKAVIPFKEDPEGEAFMITLNTDMSIKEANQALVDAGVEHKTLNDTPEGVIIDIFSPGDDIALLDTMEQFYEKHQNRISDAGYYKGRGEFLGSSNDSRPEANRIYKEILDQFQDIQGQGEGRAGVDNDQVNVFIADALARIAQSDEQSDTLPAERLNAKGKRIGDIDSLHTEKDHNDRGRAITDLYDTMDVGDTKTLRLEPGTGKGKWDGTSNNLPVAHTLKKLRDKFGAENVKRRGNTLTITRPRVVKLPPSPASRRLKPLTGDVISSRQPTAVKVVEDNLEKYLQIDYKSATEAEASFKKNTALINDYTHFRSPASDAASAIAGRYIRQGTDNLLWLHDKVPALTRKRSKQWYDGANKLANTLGPRYNGTASAAAAVFASLSPQKDWFMNVSLGERVMDIMTHVAPVQPWDEVMDKGLDEVYANFQNKDTGEWVVYDDLRDAVRGKRFYDLEDTPKVPQRIQRAAWLRVYDETNNPKSHQIVSPEGDFIGWRKSLTGEDSKVGWGSNSEIAKAISVWLDPSKENISKELGDMHKVRSFFNNIIDPNSLLGDSTMDTHAVAALTLKPLSGKSLEVGHNFGTGASRSANYGVSGMYPINGEAYRKAAEQRGILPREMQSITWEAIRGLFTDTYKGQQANLDAIESIWKQFAAGKLKINEARDQVLEHAAGINPPEWQRSDSGVDGEKFDSSYLGKIPGASKPGSRSK